MINPTLVEMFKPKCSWRTIKIVAIGQIVGIAIFIAHPYTALLLYCVVISIWLTHRYNNRKKKIEC